MKHYCKDCGMYFEYDWGYCDDDVECPDCMRKTVPVSDYETPAQYHVRTGRPYPDKGLVWTCSHTHYDPADPYGWQVKQYFELTKDDYCVLIASPPVPPPDDFVPEKN